MSFRGDETGSIRRLRSRRIDATVLVGLVLMALVAVGLLLVHPRGWSAPTTAPTEQPLSASLRVCPAAPSGKAQVVAASDASGALQSSAGLPTHAQLKAHTPVSGTGGAKPIVLSASGTAAGGFAAGSWATGPLRASDCSGPSPDAWYTGLGAGAVHDSVITLTNPTDGDAVADVLLYGPKGPVAAPSLRGVALQPGATKSFDLLRTIPMHGVLDAEISVTRGQIASSVLDQQKSLTGGPAMQEWVAPQPHAVRVPVLLGIDAGHGSHVLYVANPTQRQLTADLKLVSGSAVFTPDGAPTMTLPAQSVVSLSLDKLLRSKAAAGALGVELDATGPVTASLRRTSGNDILATTAGDRVGEPAEVLVPPGAKQLVLLGDTGTGSVTVTTSDSSGKRLGSQRLSVTADQGATASLPAGATFVEVTPSGVSVIGTVVVTQSGKNGGSATMPLRERVRRNLVPAVLPGLR